MKSWTQTLRKPVAALAAVFLLVGSALTGAAAGTGEAPAPSASTLDWNQFLGNEELKGVSDAKTPRTAEEFKKAWTARSTRETSCLTTSLPRSSSGITSTIT